MGHDTGKLTDMALRNVIGQDRAVTILLRTIERGRIPSSYLFTGDAGIGKKFTAINLAKAVNCLKNVSGSEFRVPHENSELSLVDACDECNSCRKITAAIHPDFLLLSPSGGQIKIEEIRAVEDLLSLKAFEGRKKVVIVDDAETMNSYAANAFLKTLEEPPPDSLIVLVSSSPGLLPDTIRSRCSPLHFTPLSISACEEVMQKVILPHSPGKGGRPKKQGKLREGIQESSPAEDLHLTTLVRLSMGRPGDALSGDILEERTVFVQLFRDMLHTEKDGWATKEEMQRWFEFILIFLRDMAVWQVAGNPAAIINSDLTEDIENLSRGTDLQDIINIYRTLSSLRGYFRFHLNKSLTWNYTGSLLRKTFGVNYA